jgi:hypothetical protein
VNIRGFKQENIALMLNGVPISSVENGLVYWNNWLGLSDVARQVQVQRGLGASRTALNSVGGTINIITRTTDMEEGGSVRLSVTDYGNAKATLTLSTGLTPGGIAVTFLGSVFTGPGYVDATYVRGAAYFLSITKEFNPRNMLVFTLLGNPERHGQRNFKLSSSEIDRYGLRYNKEWGSYNGEINNASENFYHKPFISLNHYWQATGKSILATSVYFSPGRGGGKWTESFGGNPTVFSYYNPSGQLDWDAIYETNSSHEQVYTLADGSDTSGYSLNIQTNFLASHLWGGLISTYQHEVSDRVKVTAGLHGRLFTSTLQEKIRDLLGGDFFIDDYAYAIDGVAGRKQVKEVGDIVKIDNGAEVELINPFGQVEYSGISISAFLSAGVSGNWYRRTDRYNYIHDQKSKWVFRGGFDVKGGLNYNLDEKNNIYLNAGFFSRAPYYKYVFGNFNNIPTRDLVNEKISTVEIGYGLILKGTKVRLAGYATVWMDRSVLTNEYNQFEDPAMLQGLDARHLGFEGEIEQLIGRWGSIRGFASFGDWVWQNDVTALLLNDDQVVVDTVNVYAEGLFVGDAPMIQLGLAAKVLFLKAISLEVTWTFNDKLYADFNPAKRTDRLDREQPYRIPAYHNLDAHITYPFALGRTKAELNLSCLNLIGSDYIIRGIDGEGHDVSNFMGFWGFGRTFNFGFGVFF